MVEIALAERCMIADFGQAEPLRLCFEGQERYFHLLFIALVVKVMRETALRPSERPYVPFHSIDSEAMALSRKVKNRPYRDVKTLADTVYQIWHRSLTTREGGILTADRRLKGDEVGKVEKLFQKQGSGTLASYRLDVAVGDIHTVDIEVLDRILAESQGHTGLSNDELALSHIPGKPFYDGLDGPDEAVVCCIDALRQAGGRPVLVWGNGRHRQEQHRS